MFEWIDLRLNQVGIRLHVSDRIETLRQRAIVLKAGSNDLTLDYFHPRRMQRLEAAEFPLDSLSKAIANGGATHHIGHKLTGSNIRDVPKNNLALKGVICDWRRVRTSFEKVM